MKDRPDKPEIPSKDVPHPKQNPMRDPDQENPINPKEDLPKKLFNISYH